MDTITQTFHNISRIIERESKSSTYKFALMRGTIDIIQESSPYIQKKDSTVFLPLGLLVEKWIIYYYPVFESNVIIPQINGRNTRLAFERYLNKIIDFYCLRGGFSAFYNDLRNKGIPGEIRMDFKLLVNSVCNTITQMPMRYIGTSINDNHYTIYQYQINAGYTWPSLINSSFLICNIGTFSIPIDYYDTFKLLGSFINGQESLLFKWAEFSVKASNKTLNISNVLNDVLKHPVTQRQVDESIRIYQEILKKLGTVNCVWTGVGLQRYHIDHLIPFSVWKNNDLWNLLPSSATINNNKRDKIPAPDLIYRRKESIIQYWETINNKLPERFKKEFRMSLIGDSTDNNWQHLGIDSLMQRCEYLISDRGYQKWDL